MFWQAVAHIPEPDWEGAQFTPPQEEPTSSAMAGLNLADPGSMNPSSSNVAPRSSPNARKRMRRSEEAGADTTS